METKKVTEEMVKALNVPLPKEALKAHPTMQGLTAINQIYIIERLNQVFGIGSWQLRNELLSPIQENSKQGTKGVYKDYTSLVKVTLTIPEYNIHMECIAGSTNKDEGDSAKGGITDCITKIASWLGIGHEVYKGRHGQTQNEEQKQEPKNTHSMPKEIQDPTKQLPGLQKRYESAKDKLVFLDAAEKGMKEKYPDASDYNACMDYIAKKRIESNVEVK